MSSREEDQIVRWHIEIRIGVVIVLGIFMALGWAHAAHKLNSMTTWCPSTPDSTGVAQ